MSERDITYIEGQPKMSRDGFILYCTMRFGEENVKRVEHTIEPCYCGSQFCKGWKIDPSIIRDVLA